MVIDGSINEVGADVCANQTITYRNDINGRVAEAGGVSPVDISGSFTVVGNIATVTATYELLDPGTFTTHQGVIYVWEDDVTWCCGYGGVNHWDDLTRVIRTSPVTLTTVGQTVTLVETWDITTAEGVACNPANLHAAAIFEETGGNKNVIQATDFVSPLPTFFPALVTGQTLKSIPNGNDTALFTCSVQNVGTAADVLNLGLTGFPWTADFLVEGDPTYYTSTSVALAPQERKEITIRVQTNGVKQIGSGTFSVASQGDNTQVRNATYKVFNDSYAVLLVDDDAGTYEVPFTTAFTNLGYLYERVTAASLGGMIGYDVVVWHTGYATSNTITATDQANLIAYMDQGGRVFVSAMDFTTGLANPNTFVND